MPTIQAIIDRQLRRWEMEKSLRAAQTRSEEPGAPLQPVITVSRQHGSSGSRIAEMLAKRFDYTLLHRDVIDRICNSSGTRRHIIESLDGHVKSQIAIWCDSMVAQRYLDTHDYVRLLLETIKSVAELGGVVVVGRGSSFIVGPDRGLHVRVVAPREVRIERLMQYRHMSRKEAVHDVDARDHERETWVRKVFARDVGDPEAYDLVVNTAGISLEAAIDVIAVAAREKFERLHAATGEAHARR
jgi:cytidylate kinase